MILLVEGTDRAGKTALCERVRVDLPTFDYLHFGVPDQPDAYSYFAERLDHFLSRGTDLVINRLHWSNVAYAGMFGGSVLTDFDWYRLDQHIAQQPAMALLLVGDPTALHQRLQLEQQVRPTTYRLASPREIGDVQNAFFRCFDRTAIQRKWSGGIETLLDLEATPPTPLPAYERLLELLRGGDS